MIVKYGELILEIVEILSILVPILGFGYAISGLFRELIKGDKEVSKVIKNFFSLSISVAIVTAVLICASNVIYNGIKDKIETLSMVNHYADANYLMVSISLLRLYFYINLLGFIPLLIITHIVAVIKANPTEKRKARRFFVGRLTEIIIILVVCFSAVKFLDYKYVESKDNKAYAWGTIIK